MLRTIIVDDEQHCLDTLEWQLSEYCPDVDLIARCNSPVEAIVQIKNFKPDLVMLDVEMPKMNAFEMLKKLEPIDFSIIFTTAYDQFALNAFKVSALDYLLKPIDVNVLKSAIAKVKEHLHNTKQDQFKLLLERMEQPNKPIQRIALPTGEGLELVEVSDIIYCESESNYCHVHLVDGSEFFITKTLKQVQEALEGGPFLRIHKSFLANMDHVARYVRGDGGYLVMKNGKSLTVARSKKDELLATIGRL